MGLYLLATGSDFMEFRFMVVVLPLLAVVLTALLVMVRSRWQYVLAGALVLALPLHGLLFRGAVNVDSVASLAAYVNDPGNGWLPQGEQLRDALGGGPAAEEPGSGAPVLAVTAAGALPYAARLRAVDMLGLTDPWTAENGVRIASGRLFPKPGHMRMATIPHLVDEGVNLVLGHPQVGPPRQGSYGVDDITRMFYGSAPDLDGLPSGARAVEMPVGDGQVMWMLYLQPDDRVDELIRSGTWRTVPLSVPG